MTGILNALIAGVSGAVKDTYFNLVSLLLPGNGTDGANNNVFQDSSGNGFTISRNPTAGPNAPTQGTFSPFSQTGWGNYFDGTGDTLTTAATTAYDFANNPFTIEAFVYTTSFATGQGIVSSQNNGSTNISGWVLTIETTGAIAFIDYSSGAGALVVQSSSGAILANKWHHVVVEKRGTGTNQFQIFVDGTAVATGTSNANVPAGTSNQPLTIANWRYSTDPNREFTGYISNLRIVKSAVYNGTVVVPTAPFPTGTTNQVLLTCQSNRFVDSNTATTAQTLTVNGSPSVTSFSPFAPTSSYSASAVGGSGYFDGNVDSLTTPNVTALNLYNTTNTVECWVYPLSFSSDMQIYGTDFDGTYYTVWRISGTTGYPRYFSRNGTSIAGSTGLTLNQWNHVAWGRSGTTVSIWLNGSRVANGTITTEDQWGTGVITTGRFNNGDYLNGYLSGLRVVKGSDVYGVSNTSITVPTTPFTAITNTAYLLNFTNAGVVDATAKNVLETVGNAQISTTQSKWGGGSIRFDGTSNTSCMIAQGRWQPFFGANFSIEMWFRVDALSGVQTLISQDWRRGIDGPKFALFIGEASSDRLTYFANSGSISIIAGAGNAISANTWYFVQVIKSGSTTTMYLNGTSIGSAADTYTYPVSTYATYIGRSDPGGSVQGYLTGYIDDLRVTVGQARTAGTATAPFPLQ